MLAPNASVSYLPGGFDNGSVQHHLGQHQAGTTMNANILRRLSSAEVRPELAFTVVAIFFACIFFAAYQTLRPAEDAVILYEYAKNLASRGIITYGSGNTLPVEGATDFLYMAAIALLSKLGVSQFGAALLLNCVATILLCDSLRRLGLSFWATSIAIVATPFFYASLAGFGVMVFSCAYLWCLYLLLRNEQRFYLSILLLCLIRPDGVVWGAGLVAMRLIHTDRTGFWSETRRLLLHLVVPGLVYYAWRLWYFDEWLPLPFIVKSSGAHSWFQSAQCVLVVIAPAAAGALCSENRPLIARRLLLLFALPALFYSALRLEQNVGDRFLAPLFFGALGLFAAEGAIVKTTVIVLTMYSSWQWTTDTFDSIRSSGQESSRPISRQLAHLAPGKLLTTESGDLAFFNNWSVEDSWGLNTPRFAHHLITADDVQKGAYDLIVAHCELRFLTGTPDPVRDAPVGRNWGNQCLALTAFIRASDYETFLVPLGFAAYPIFATLQNRYKFPLSCSTYLIYAISPSYVQKERLGKLLEDYGAIPLPDVRGIVGYDSICSSSP